MAETLEEFLVSVKYGIDEPSQAKFFDALKRVSTSIAGIAGQIVGLGIAVLKLSDHMSEAGAKLYWMGQRVNDSVGNIQAMSFALTELGLSGEHATTALNQITQWTVSRGPAATAYLRSLGITATTASGQLQELGKRLLASGERGSIGYAIELARMKMFGLDEETLRRLGSKEYEEKQHEEGMITRIVWGKDGAKGPDKFAAASVKIAAEFGKMGYVFTSLSQKFAFGLFEKIQKPLEELNERLIKAIPQIQAFLEQLIGGAPALLHFLEKAIAGFGTLLEIGTSLIKTWHELPEILKFAVEAFLLLPKALELLKSPLFWIMGGLLALLLLLDDYKHYQDDLKHPGEKRTSAFNYGKMDEMFKGLEDNKFLKAMKDFYGYMKESFEKATGIKGVFDEIGVVIGLIVARYGIPALLGLMGRGAVAGIGAGIAAAGGAAAFFAGFVLPVTVLGAVTIAGTYLADLLDKQLQVFFKYLNIDRKMDLKDPIETPWWMPEGRGGSAPTPQWFTDFTQWMKQHGPTGYQEPGMTDPELAPPDPSKRFRPQFPSILRKRTSMMQGGVQVASADDTGWAAAALLHDFDTTHEDDGRLYDMIKLNLEAILAKLSDILDKITDMAKQAGGGVGGGGGGGGDPDAGYTGDVSALGMSSAEYDIFRKTMGGKESGNRYTAQNRFGFKGKYQFGADEIRETAKSLGETPPSIAQFLGDPAMQERYMAQYTLNHHRQLMRDPVYRAMSPTDQAGVLGAAHISGVQGALAMIHNRVWRNDANGEGNTSYRRMILDALRRGHASLDMSGAARSFAVNNSTSISVTAPNPASAAMQVAEHSERINEHHIRFAKGSLLA